MIIDFQDAKVERLHELGLALKYEQVFPEGCFVDSLGRRHDHSCCPDCCGCEEEYSRFMTFEEWMKN